MKHKLIVIQSLKNTPENLTTQMLASIGSLTQNGSLQWYKFPQLVSSIVSALPIIISFAIYQRRDSEIINTVFVTRCYNRRSKVPAPPFPIILGGMGPLVVFKQF